MRTFAVILTIVGALLFLFAFHSADQIPGEAFDAGMRRGRYPDIFISTVMQMDSQRRLLQNLYMGSAGLILLFLGIQTFCREQRINNNTN